MRRLPGGPSCTDPLAQRGCASCRGRHLSPGEGACGSQKGRTTEDLPVVPFPRPTSPMFQTLTQGRNSQFGRVVCCLKPLPQTLFTKTFRKQELHSLQRITLVRRGNGTIKCDRGSAKSVPRSPGSSPGSACLPPALSRGAFTAGPTVPTRPHAAPRNADSGMV